MTVIEKEIVRQIVREATGWQILRFTLWFIRDNEKADIIMGLMLQGITFKQAYETQSSRRKG